MLTAEWQMYHPLEMYFHDAGLLVLRELTTPEGRVDVAAARIDWKAAEARVAAGMTTGLTTTTLARAFTRLPPRQPVGLSEWAAAVGVSRGTMTSIARQLSSSGFVVRAGDLFRRATAPMSIVQELICCEAKLDDWRGGLMQAHGHRFYADRSYLALASRPTKLDRSLLSHRGIGLLVLDHARVVREVAAPKRVRARAITRLVLEERFWERAVVPTLMPDALIGPARATA